MARRVPSCPGTLVGTPMLIGLHYLLLTAYAATPVFYAALMLQRWHRDRDRSAVRELGATATGALLLGGGIAVFFAVAAGGRPRYDQAMLAWLYFMTVMLAIKGLMVVGR